MELNGIVVVLTGAGSGIGLALGQLWKKQGIDILKHMSFLTTRGCRC
jgi:NADP-dependent 3-hydroxy acid dehydrogenase YdfG